MKNLTSLMLFAGLLFFGADADRAAATTITWTLNASNFNDGGNVAGSFLWDVTTSSVTEFNFTVFGGNIIDFPSQTLSSSDVFYGVQKLDLGSGSHLLMFIHNTGLFTRDLIFNVTSFTLLDTPVERLQLVGGSVTGASGLVETFNFVPGTPITDPMRNVVGSPYLSAQVPLPAVPLPAALPLLMSALGFFRFFGWRRKRMAAA